LEWRADGSAFGRKGNIDVYGTGVGHDYTRCPEDKTTLPSTSSTPSNEGDEGGGGGDGGGGGCPLDEETVNELLAKRLDAKIRRDFELADAIRDDLAASGVKVEDRLKLWRAGTPRGVWMGAGRGGCGVG